MTTALKINGETIKTKLFKTRQAAENFINKKEGRKLVYFKAHEYFVSI
jgi:hypothetical protein